MSVGRALEQFDDDREGALDSLLEAWRETRAPAIADLIDLVSADVTRALPPITGKTRRAFQEAWIDVASEGRSIDVGRLVASFSREPCTQIPDRLARFEAQGHDPRVAAELARFAGVCPCTSNPNFPMWTRLWHYLVELRDPRMRGPLAAKLTEKAATNFEFVHFPRIERALAGIVDPPPLSHEDAARVEALAKKARASCDGPPPTLSTKKKPKSSSEKTDEDFLAIIYDDPISDGPRLVYGDWLLERGDPRGEFIAFQFKKGKSTKAEGKRHRVLLAKHERQWMGAIEPVIARGEAAFERGFLATCKTAFRTPRQIETLVGERAWSTVHTVRAAPFELLVSPTMRALRSVREIHQGLAARLADHDRQLSIAELAFGVVESSADHRSIARAAALPALTSLELYLPSEEDVTAPSIVPDDFEWLLAGPLGARLEKLKISGWAGRAFLGARPDLGAWLGAVASLTKLTTIDFDVQFNWKLSLEREGNRWALTLHAYDSTDTATLEPVFRNVPHGAFARVTTPAGGGADLARLLRPFTPQG